MTLVFLLLLFILLFGIVSVLSIVGKVLGGVLRLFGVKSSFHVSSNAYSSTDTADNDTQLVRSELGAKRMRQFKELAQETDFEEEYVDR
ncbi:MAG: hypothetical protein J6Y37_18215 [Paludibacteraceae bacterium]|nr:hypothetical protein [Paludibacteraceae bacterium]